MRENHPGALVPAHRSTPQVWRSKGLIVRLGTKALVSLSKNRPVRQMALVGAAFSIGYRLSRMRRTGQLPQLMDDVKGMYRAASGDVRAEGKLAGNWFRQSITVVAAAYKSSSNKDSRNVT